MANMKDGKVWTAEERELRHDTDRPTTIANDRRCADRYKGIDCYGIVVPMRCTEPATVRVHVVENPDGGYDAAVCESCAARLQEPLPEFEFRVV